MRVTLDLDDQLLADAREYVRRTGLSLSAVVQEGLWSVLAAGEPEAGNRLPDLSVGDVTTDDPLEGYSPEEMRDIAYGGPDAPTWLERWRRLPPVDPDALRRDIDSVIDQSLWRLWESWCKPGCGDREHHRNHQPNVDRPTLSPPAFPEGPDPAISRT